jgi:hypothetical protein
MVKLCDGKLYVLGRDFARGEWIPASQYCIVLKEATEPETEASTEEVTDAPTEAPTEVPTDAPTDIPVSDTDPIPDATPDGTTAETPTETPKSGCGSSLALPLLFILLPAVCAVIRRKEN